MTALIHVCQRCQDRDAARGEMSFSSALVDRLAHTPQNQDFEVVLQQCLGMCAPDATISITARGCWSWLFRGSRIDQDLADFIVFLKTWRSAPNGLPAKAARPVGLRAKTARRLPPNLRSGEAIPHPGHLRYEVAPSFSHRKCGKECG